MLSLLLIVNLAGATPTTISLTATADSAIFAESGDLASGADDGLFVGINGNTGGFNERRALLRFDLSAIPNNASIQSASLTLVLTRSVNAGDVNIGLHRLSASWGEGLSTAIRGGGQGGAATPDSATWVYRFWNDPTKQWNNPGGDFVANASATSTLGNTVGSAFSWSSAQVANDVQSWLQTPTSNQGWILIAANNSNTTTAKRLASREFATIAQRPRLDITYNILPIAQTVPLPAWVLPIMTCLLLAIGYRLTRVH
jgi:hypothetical protein